MAESDLIPVQCNTAVPPRPPSATSIPGLLRLLRSEYDATMLELFKARMGLDRCKKGLCQELYTHEAAVHVIARLTRERDEARAALGSAAMQQSYTEQFVREQAKAEKEKVALGAMGSGARSAAAPAAAAAAAAATAEPDSVAPNASGEDDTDEAWSAIMKDVHVTASELQASRKTRVKAIAAGRAAKGEISAWAELSSHRPHSKSTPGIRCCAVVQRGGGDDEELLVLTGGANKHAQVFDIGRKKTKASLKGHTKAVTAVACDPKEARYFTGGEDAVIRVWQPKQRGNGYTAKKIIRNAHSGTVTAVGLHPTGQLFGTTSADGSWAVHHLANVDAMRTTVGGAKSTGGLESFSFHPDGSILATGGGDGDGSLKIWSLSGRTVVATLPTADDDGANGASSAATASRGAVCDLSFSENGYHLATAHAHSGSAPACIRLWDLRKQRCLATVEGSGSRGSVHFDKSGGFLAYSIGLDVNVVASKKWSTPLLSFNVAKKAGEADGSCSARFARCVSAGTLVVATSSGALKVVGAA